MFVMVVKRALRCDSMTIPLIIKKSKICIITMTNSVQRQGSRIAAEKRTLIGLMQLCKPFSTKARMNIKTGRLDGSITSEWRFETNYNELFIIDLILIGEIFKYCT